MYDLKLRERIVERYVNGESSNRLGRVYGITPTTITNWIKEAGEKVRYPTKRIEDKFAGRKVSRQRNYQLRKAVQGRCQICGGEPSQKSWLYCEKHRLMANNINLAKYYRNKEKRKGVSE